MTLAYLLDTNVLSETMRAEPDRGVVERVVEAADAVATASVVWHELWYGVERLPRTRRRRALERVLEDLEAVLVVLPYDAAAARWHARERARLIAAGRTPPFVDGQIASIAAVHGLTLVTRNRRDFAGYRGLLVESWG